MKHNPLKKQKIKFQNRAMPNEMKMGNKEGKAGSFLLGMAISLILSTTHSFANPVGGRVVAGSATISQTSPGRLDIVQRSHKAILDWNGFSIQSGEHTHFQQPSVSSMALNRVTGSQASSILGNLTANGRVLLVNPNGVLFGKNAQVNVGSLIATTSDINNDDFMAGRFVFDKGSNALNAAVVNRGQIEVTEGGAVVLAATSVVNEGLINARLGQVVLAGTESFTLDFNGDGLLQFDLGGNAQNESPANQSNNSPISNTGTIAADGGIVQMTTNVANTVVDHVINMEGVIQARAVDVQGGTIILSGGENGIVAVSGLLDVSGEEPGQVGGVVKVLGDKVGLFDGAAINASGDAGGGTVLVGGNYQGKGPEPRAQRTIVAENTLINADAQTDGDGGTVVLWSDEFTAFSGEISAKGGVNGGDGGLVEVSGKQDLMFRGQVDLNSTHGLNGTLLLDPLDIVITSQPDPNDDDGLTDDQILAGESPGVTFTISEQTLETLSADANIILEATNDISISGLSDDILAFQSSSGSVTFLADADNDQVGTFSLDDLELQTQGGNLTIEAANIIEQGVSSEITTNGGDIRLISSDLFDMRFLKLDSSSSDVGGNISVEASSNVVLSGRPLNIDSTGGTQAGNVSLTSRTGFVDIGRVDTFSIAGAGGQININAQNDISTGTLTSVGATSGGDVSLISTAGDIDTAFAKEGHPFNPINTSAIDGPGGNVSLTSNAGFVDVGDVDTSSAAGTGGQININSQGFIFVDDLNSSGGTAGGNVDLVSVSIDGEGLVDTGDIDTSSTAGIGGQVNINAQDFIFVDDLNSSGVAAGGNVSVTSNDSFVVIGDVDTSSAAGTGGQINMNAQGIILTDALNSSGVTRGGNVDLISASIVGEDLVDTGDVDTSSTAGIGGQINMSAQAGIHTLALNSSGATGGGNVILTSNDSFVDIGDVDASSAEGIGGQININAQDNIVTDALNSSGVTAGGNVNLVSVTGDIINVFDGDGEGPLIINPINTSSTEGPGGNVVINTKELLSIGGINTSGSSSSNGGNISLTANEINLSAGLVSTGGTLLLQPFSPSQNIEIGGEFDSDFLSELPQTSTLDITASDLGFITGPFESLTIGRDNGSGSISIDPAGVNFNQTTTIRSPDTGGSIFVDGQIQMNSTDLTLSAGNDISIFNNISTKGGDINLNTDLNDPGSIFISGIEPEEGPDVTTLINTNGGNFTAIGVGKISSELTNAISINNTHINAAGGNIKLNGSDLDGVVKEGIIIHQGSIIETLGVGTITLEGTSMTSGSHGVLVRDTGTTLRSENGSIEIIGDGGSVTGSQNNDGVSIFNGGVVETTGTGDIFITGAGGDGTDNQGIAIGSGSNNDSISVVQSAGGNIKLVGTGMGTGGALSDFGNHGIFIFDNASISTLGNGSFTFQGESGSNGAGIFVSNVFGSQAPITISTLNDVAKTTFQADTINLDTPTEVSGNGIIELEPLNSSLDLTVKLGDSIKDGFSEIFIGHENGTGTVTLVTDDNTENGIVFNDKTTLRSPDAGGNIVVDGAIQTNGNNLALTAGSSVDVNADITTTGGSIDITSGPGGIDTTDSTLRSLSLNGSGGDITFNAAGNIITGGQIIAYGTSTGGNINFTSTNGGIDVGNTLVGGALVTDGQGNELFTTETGGGIVLTASSNISTGEIFSVGKVQDGAISINSGGAINVTGALGVPTNSSEGIGGDIALTAEDDITTNDMSSSGVLGSGSIVLASNTGSISSGDINTSSAVGNGGDLSILAASDLSLNNINTSSGGAGKGGDISASITNGGLTVNQGIFPGNGNLDLAASDAVVFTNDFESLGNISVTGNTISLHNVSTTGSQTYTGSVEFNSDYLTNGGGFTVNGPSLLLSDTSVNTNGGAIAFNGEVNGSNALTLEAGSSGNVLFADKVGAESPLGSIDIQSANAVVFTNEVESLGNLSVTANSIALHDISTTGSQTYTGSVEFNSDYLTNGGGFTINGSSLLLSDTSVNTSGGAIAFNGEVNGSNALTLEAGNSGNVLFADKVGAESPLGSIDIKSADAVVFTNDVESLRNLSVKGNTIALHDVSTKGSQTYTGSVDFNSDYLTNGGDFTVNGPSLLLSDTSVNTSGGAIAFNGEVNGSNALTLEAGSSGNIMFADKVGAESPLGSIDIKSADAVVFTNDVESLGNLSVKGDTIALHDVSTKGSQTYTGSVEFYSNYLTNGAGFTVNGPSLLLSDTSVNTSGGAIAFNGEVNGSNALTLEAGSSGNIMFADKVGAESPLGSIDIKSADAVVFTNDVESLDNISVTANTIALHDVSTKGSQTYTGSVEFNSDYLTNGGGFTVNGPSLLLSDTSVNTSGGAITFDGEVNGSNALMLEAGSSGNVLFADKVGAESPLGSIDIKSADAVVFTNEVESLGNISVKGNTIALQDVSTKGSQTYTGSVEFNSDYLTNGGGFTVNGPSLLLSATSVNTSGGEIVFNGEVNGSKKLTLDAGDLANILFNGDVGVLNQLDVIDIKSANNLTVLGRMLAEQLNVVYQGDFSTELTGFLEVDSLFISPNAKSATLEGIIGGASGKDAVFMVEGPTGNERFTINDCTIGVSCEEVPAVVEPQIPPKIFQKDRSSSESSVAEPPSVVSVAQRSAPSDDPVQYQFSNLGNEELWDNNPGGYSVSSFAAFTVSSPDEELKKDEEKKSED